MTTTTITTYAPCEYCKGEGRKLLRRFDPLLAYEKCPACNGERRVVVKVEKFEVEGDRLAVGGKQRKGAPMPGTKASGLSKRFDGTVVRR